MKNQHRGFMSGLLASVLLVGTLGTAVATVGQRTVNVDYNDIKVTLNGAAVDLVDANGAPVEPFAINGTTYLPVRAVSSALGLDVGWDGATKTVVLKDNRGMITESVFILKAGQYTVGEDIPAGKYSCKAVSGSGNFMGDVSSQLFGSLNQILAAEEETIAINMGYHSTYENLKLADGDTLQITSNLEIEFTKK